MTKIFISHSTADDDFVRRLRQALADQGHDGWIDSRELRGGDLLWPTVQAAIEDASAYAVVVSPDGLQSRCVGDELVHALEIQKQRGKEQYPVLPLSLDGTRLGVMERFFADAPAYIPVSSDPGGIEAAMHAILVALGERLPTDVPATPQPPAEPLEELVLELTDLRFQQHAAEGQAPVRRASARARLVYAPATPGQEAVHSERAWRLVDPLGPLDTDDLRWYLEDYATWPSGVPVIQERAGRVEQNLETWGRALHAAAMPLEHTANVRDAWTRIDDHAGRRFSVHVDVDATLEAGAPETEVEAAREAATVLLGLPWELLHDGKSFLFQGARPTRVRRRLPRTQGFDVPVVATPIRILLVTARPEDDACGYIDHRVSALPLVEAMEALPGLVALTVLSPPTLPALRLALERARDARRPYQVVHFDGHGVYDRQVGLGGLCFEHPDDTGRLDGRRHLTVYTNALGPLLREHRIPLVFLEACQSAVAESVSESVASELLKVGVASVVAMSHSVLVETARRFVAVFYTALADGRRVGDAMLAGQRALAEDPTRGRVFGTRALRLQDWFVPVLFQEKDDPQLFKSRPAEQTRADFQQALAARLGALPPAPATGFIGRSRELLALQRLLMPESDARAGARYAVIRGQGGEGKTALAAELARWLVRSHQVRRAAFVSVEIHGNLRAVVDALGRQLVGAAFSAAGELEDAIQQVERALREERCLLVVDNMESLLLPPYLAEATPDALTEEARAELAEILSLCERLLGAGDTRLVFTSREALPAPFDAKRNRRELHRLAPEDAIKLVERVLDAADGGGGAVAAGDAAGREAIERLVDAVHGHARTLALLAPSLQSQGVEATRAALTDLMADMARRFPTGHPQAREQSVFAGVELSLRRLSEANRERVRVLGVFHGGVQLAVLRVMTDWDEADLDALAADLVQTGLATPDPYNHLTLNPALCPYLHARLDDAEREALTARWVEAMGGYVAFLEQQSNQDTELAATLTQLELANLFALLEQLQAKDDPAATIDLATSLYGLLQNAGKPRLLGRVATARDAAAKALGDGWSHAGFEAQRTRIEQQLAGGDLQGALTGARALLARARAAGEAAYRGADYDLAMACWLLGRVLRTAGGAEQALPLLAEAEQRFEAIAEDRSSRAAARMASACISERGECLWRLGRLDEAAAAYEEGIRRDEERGDARDVAVGKGQLGSVRKDQRRYQDALDAYAEAREAFTRLGEPGSVAVFWHQTGLAYEGAGQPQAAEAAYRQSLQIEVQLGNVAGQAGTLGQLGTLYDDALDRPEDAAGFYRQAADKSIEVGDVAMEGVARSNLAETLRRLGRLDEARREVERAIACKAPFGHAAEPWKSFGILAAIETDAGNPPAAQQARGKARAAYLAYRRDGGENHALDGRLALAVAEHLLAGDPAAAAALLAELEAEPDLPDSLRPFLAALQAIAAGSRDPALAEDPALHYISAAEVLLLIEALEQAGR
ncbi:tetratricopeptide repeat protein [uncultured Thiohalocapsa sp.]|uniref:tetratricopeptide repeat protein n=1 Tax=uncultured Thiohalocapsa sp. TaxID=768990 RepID=UPI0025E8FBB6|nr:tetratricopeptide repeat protein [uncultured Thiohalocapsa sp.]